MMPVTFNPLEWSDAAITIMGGLLLASRSEAAAWSWVLFTIGNVVAIAYALQTHQHGILVKQAALLGISLLGIWRWLVKPALDDLWVGWPR